jgi:hypothetical protein
LELTGQNREKLHSRQGLVIAAHANLLAQKLIRSAAARKAMARTHYFSLNFSQSKASISVLKALILTLTIKYIKTTSLII